jgi:hypothetical protein
MLVFSEMKKLKKKVSKSGDEPDLDKKEPEKYSYTSRVVSYHNVKANIEIQKRAQKGFELFGKFFLNFWD